MTLECFLHTLCSSFIYFHGFDCIDAFGIVGEDNFVELVLFVEPLEEVGPMLTALYSVNLEEVVGRKVLGFQEQESDLMLVFSIYMTYSVPNYFFRYFHQFQFFWKDRLKVTYHFMICQVVINRRDQDQDNQTLQFLNFSYPFEID